MRKMAIYAALNAFPDSTPKATHVLIVHRATLTIMKVKLHARCVLLDTKQ